MSFWNTALNFFWREESSFVLLMVLVLAGILLHFRSDQRKSLFSTMWFFLACLVGQFISGLMYAGALSRGAEVLHETFVIGGGLALIRLWGLLVFRILLPGLKVYLPRITEDIFVIVAYVVWGLVRLRYAGLDLTGILATSAIITAVLAFSMQDTLGNILGGLALQLENSIVIGDWIKVDDVSGKVVDIRWRSTLVETRNWETVVFPNSQLMKGKFLVLGRRTGQPVQWRRWVWFNVALDTPPPKVVSVVETAIHQAEIANVAKKPLPSCLLMDINEKSYARYALRYWLTDLLADDPTDATLRWHIITALERAGIKLAMEERAVHVTKENEKYEEAVHRREIMLRLKTLRKVDLLAPMTDDELTALADHLRYSPFAKGNIITKQGDEKSHWLYILFRGEADVYLETPGGGRRFIRTLGQGNFFGEMGLMTGAPRSASVVAKTDVECYRLDKDAFEEILRARPAIAEEISHILVARKNELDAMLQEIGIARVQPEAAQQHREILSTIRRFFGLGS
jgi:CRP-like cAMP-binding protein/small-conductance mechanosensitive channel